MDATRQRQPVCGVWTAGKLTGIPYRKIFLLPLSASCSPLWRADRALRAAVARIGGRSLVSSDTDIPRVQMILERGAPVVARVGAVQSVASRHVTVSSYLRSCACPVSPTASPFRRSCVCSPTAGHHGLIELRGSNYPRRRWRKSSIWYSGQVQIVDPGLRLYARPVLPGAHGASLASRTSRTPRPVGRPRPRRESSGYVFACSRPGRVSRPACQCTACPSPAISSLV